MNRRWPLPQGAHGLAGERGIYNNYSSVIAVISVDGTGGDTGQEVFNWAGEVGRGGSASTSQCWDQLSRQQGPRHWGREEDWDAGESPVCAGWVHAGVGNGARRRVSAPDASPAAWPRTVELAPRRSTPSAPLLTVLTLSPYLMIYLPLPYLTHPHLLLFLQRCATASR